MEEVSFNVGDIIFREGEDSDFAYIIKHGKVDIFKRLSKGTVLLASLGDGEVFGEMGLLSESARSASAAADAPTVLYKLTRSSINEMCRELKPEMLLVLKALMERLRETNQKVSKLVSKQEEFQLARHGEALAIKQVTLLPLSTVLKEQMNKNGMVLNLPFRVGSLPEWAEASPLDWNNLAIKGADANLLSRNHFSIQKSERGLSVMDRGSKLGTIVNNTKIGGSSSTFQADLNYGENEIVAGDENSPYRFCVVWE